MASFNYNDGLRNGDRTPTLWIVHKGRFHTFKGQSIPEVAAITASEYKKNGKWSNTTYQMELAAGAVGCYLLGPLHGQTWPENSRMAAYERFVREFAVTVSFDAFDEALQRDYPRAHARMLEGEKALESLDTDEEGDGAELVEISTSRPSGRTPHSDVRITGPDGRSWVVAHEAPKGTEIPGVAKLHDVRHRPGHGGGITTLVFALSVGGQVNIQSYPRDGEAYLWALGRDGDGMPPSPRPTTAVSAEVPAVEEEPTAPATADQLAGLLARFGDPTRKPKD